MATAIDMSTPGAEPVHIKAGHGEIIITRHAGDAENWPTVTVQHLIDGKLIDEMQTVLITTEER